MTALQPDVRRHMPNETRPRSDQERNSTRRVRTGKGGRRMEWPERLRTSPQPRVGNGRPVRLGLSMAQTGDTLHG